MRKHAFNIPAPPRRFSRVHAQGRRKGDLFLQVRALPTPLQVQLTTPLRLGMLVSKSMAPPWSAIVSSGSCAPRCNRCARNASRMGYPDFAGAAHGVKMPQIRDGAPRPARRAGSHTRRRSGRDGRRLTHRQHVEVIEFARWTLAAVRGYQRISLRANRPSAASRPAVRNIWRRRSSRHGRAARYLAGHQTHHTLRPLGAGGIRPGSRDARRAIDGEWTTL